MDKPAMQPARSEYVRRHIERVVAAAQLQPESKVLEVGAGLGKFTLPLLDRGFDLSCVDLSPVMLEKLVQLAPRPLPTIVADVAEVAKHTDQRFDRAIGFFTLHHMPDLSQAFKGLSEVLLPGARIAFCEPRALNPLYYLQVAFTPRMTWQAERGIINMRREPMFKALLEAGFEVPEMQTYGFFPPVVVNQGWGATLEDELMKRSWLNHGHAFTLFTARKPL
ncbi:class I SAM-dependent methyltransferase [Methylomagnum sp.]